MIRNLTLSFHGTERHVIQFGSGNRHLIMLPGLGDGLTTVKGLAFAFAWLYRMYAKEYTVTCISRPNQMPENFSTKQMAEDVIWVMDQLNIDKAAVYGVSMGGMIAQHIAIDYPERVSQLVLSVTSSRCNDQMTSCIKRWLKMTEQGQYKELMKDNVISMYTQEYCNKNLWLVNMTALMKPKSFERFTVMAHACMTHDAHANLHQIQCPVLILGAQNDQVVTSQASLDIKDQISHAELIMYPDYGHAVYDEAKGYDAKILDFLTKTRQ